MNHPLIKVKDVTIGFRDKGSVSKVTDKVSFQLGKGEILGVVGESGSGKTMTALAIMGLLSKDAEVLEGSILFEHKDLLKLKQEELRKINGNQISMIFQEPMTSLNPVITIGHQIEEMLLLHEPELHSDERKKRVLEALQEADLKDPESLFYKYPHQLSGGMRQRVMIAMAMICSPKVLIADEPTTALDVTIQAKILKLIKKLNKDHGTSVILISHDLGVIKSICKRALVMQDGKIVEEGTVEEIFSDPVKDYTKKLLAAMPGREKKKLYNEAAEKETYQGHSKKLEVESTKKAERDCTEAETEAKRKSEIKEVRNTDEVTILEVHDLDVFYEENVKKVFAKKKLKKVVNKVSLSVKYGEVLGIVGESGSGKSTLAKAITGLIKDVSGEIKLKDKKPQMVFQDPYGSLNPAKKVSWILEEPLRIAGGYTRQERKEKVLQILKEVGLKEKLGERYLSQLSGGQRQRVAIGAAIIQNSRLIVLDEPVSALDVTVQAQILELLKKLREEHDLSYLFISHDLNVIYQMCDRVCVMYQGEIVETADAWDLFHQPNHPYSKKLLETMV
ncbi:MAG: ABC transporter ATP-binding protein [Anaerocolumna aminovalerica]|uniref:dipeptide ABC transporter ATP-binding protein n=1 Tax=Anaerocolumna aminovalerica TaxID=1527 RepID=UPI00248C79A3|nr:ABC transporter ATP-binding protein [Anaerocolumna aminovalerica]MDU6265915.1 ABC transporter ATP-binding protein [Anaerocolumna aminovalerica]